MSEHTELLFEMGFCRLGLYCIRKGYG